MGNQSDIVAARRAQRRSVVEIAPEVHRHPRPRARARPSARRRAWSSVRRCLTARGCERRKRRQSRVRGTNEPNAFALALFADAVHAVVPVARANERKSVAAIGQAPIERHAQCSNRVARFPRLSAERNVRLTRFQSRSFEERKDSSSTSLSCVASNTARQHRRATRGHRRSRSARPCRNGQPPMCTSPSTNWRAAARNNARASDQASRDLAPRVLQVDREPIGSAA